MSVYYSNSGRQSASASSGYCSMRSASANGVTIDLSRVCLQQLILLQKQTMAVPHDMTIPYATLVGPAHRARLLGIFVSAVAVCLWNPQSLQTITHLFVPILVEPALPTPAWLTTVAASKGQAAFVRVPPSTRRMQNPFGRFVVPHRDSVQRSRFGLRFVRSLGLVCTNVGAFVGSYVIAQRLQQSSPKKPVMAAMSSDPEDEDDRIFFGRHLSRRQAAGLAGAVALEIGNAHIQQQVSHKTPDHTLLISHAQRPFRPTIGRHTWCTAELRRGPQRLETQRPSSGGCSIMLHDWVKHLALAAQHTTWMLSRL